MALETYVPQRGAVTIETLHDGDLVGWSWLVSPHRTVFDARAGGPVHTVEFDGRCLRGKSEADPALGYDLLTRFVAVIVDRLQATRLQLLDVYGHSAPEAARAPMVPASFQVVHRTPETGDTWTYRSPAPHRARDA